MFDDKRKLEKTVDLAPILSGDGWAMMTVVLAAWLPEHGR
jgi:hypothetical protein